IFAIGNMLHPVDTADIAALDGAAVADHVVSYLATREAPAEGYALQAEGALRWVAPARITGTARPPRGRLLFWTDEYRPFPRVVLHQGDRVVGRTRLWWPASPGRVFRVPSSILRGVNPADGTVSISV